MMITHVQYYLRGDVWWYTATANGRPAKHDAIGVPIGSSEHKALVWLVNRFPEAEIAREDGAIIL